MSRAAVTAESFGRDVLGPVIGEFCLRLWSLASLMPRPDDTALLFCARGGLRMQLAYERFLAASGLPSPVHVAPLMVSRVVAVRPTLMRTVEDGGQSLLPAAATALSYEFSRATVSDVALAVSGAVPRPGPAWAERFSPERFGALLTHPDGGPVVEALSGQAALFGRHLRAALGDRRHAVLVDTGLYGTTAQLLSEGLPALDFSSALIARSYRPGPPNPRTFGLSVEAAGYVPLRRRTTLLRYWHFVEWLFEPELASVRSFTADEHGEPVSNLEVAGWREKVAPPTGHPFTGVLDYLGALPHGPAETILRDADVAWGRLRRAVVWPDHAHGDALVIGTRSHDFGLEGTWSHRPWRGPVAALRGSTMWREGEIARSGSPLRRPLLAAIETAYGARYVTRRMRRR